MARRRVNLHCVSSYKSLGVSSDDAYISNQLIETYLTLCEQQLLVCFGSHSSTFRIIFEYFLDRILVLSGCRSQILGIADHILVPPSCEPKNSNLLTEL